MNLRFFLKNVGLLVLINLTLSGSIKAEENPIATLSVQDEWGIGNVVLPSPTAAIFERYGNYPVNKAFGTPSISIPLFTANSGDVQLPVSISYHAGGNKVDDPGGSLGLGWSLSMGGVISRTLNGLPDELSECGYLEFNSNKL